MTQVLIIDDDPISLTIISTMIVNYGMTPVGVESLKEAHEILKSPGMDIKIILLDLILDKEDGFKFLLDRKNDPKLAIIPTVVLSALERRVFIRRALALGASDYLIKPIDPDLFSDVMERIKFQEELKPGAICELPDTETFIQE